MAETYDERAERLLRIALDVAVRIREEAPDVVAREFHGLDYGELRDLALLAAACVDVTRPVSQVVWWAEIDRLPAVPRHGLLPCGTHAAFERHRAHGEEPCVACRVAERKRDRERKRRPLRAVA